MGAAGCRPCCSNGGGGKEIIAGAETVTTLGDPTDDDLFQPATAAVPLVLISDPGQDLDDEMTYIMLRHLVAEGQVEVRGIVTTLAPAFDRARLCRGTLDTLGLYGVPIGVGTDGGDVEGKHKAATFEDWAHTYMPVKYSESALSFEPGQRLLLRLYHAAAPKSLSLVIIAALKDPALFLRDSEELFVAKTKEVVIMGGVESWDQEAKGPVTLSPDTAHNNMFDASSSRFFYRRCQELGVPLIVVSRWTAYASKVPRSCYDDLAALGSAIGCRLRNAQRASIEGLWARACAPAGSEARAGLPDRCDRNWFIKTFCGGTDDAARDPGDTIWDLVVGFMQYDTIATLAALPALRKRFFAPVVVPGQQGTSHMVIGRTEEDHGVTDPNGLGLFLNTGYSQGLALNHSYKMRFVLLAQPRWNNQADELIAIVVFRALYELGIVDCMGIIVSPPPDEADTGSDNTESTLEHVKAIEDTLRTLGLPHVPVLLAGNAPKDGSTANKVTAADHLKDVYDVVPPAGVSLVVTASLSDVNEFAGRHPKIFREKTQSVILLSGAEVVNEGGGQRIEPDSAAQNNSLDLPAAKQFFARAQQELVPLVVISRHYSAACKLPRALFDALGTHGGAIGKILYDAQRSAIYKLWEAVCAPPSKPELRRGLPARCDRNWFVSTFCTEGAVVDEQDIWSSSLRGFNVYAALAVLAVVPTIFSHIANERVVSVRSVCHMLVGESAVDNGVKSIVDLRNLLFQGLFSGCRLNASDFDWSPPPPISLDGGGSWSFDEGKEALDWVLEPNAQATNSLSTIVRIVAQASFLKKQNTVRSGNDTPRR